MTTDLLDAPLARVRETDAVVLERMPAEAGSPVLERLHALVRKGYRPEIGTSTETGFVILRHVGKAPDLVLHSDGTVSGFEGRRPRYKRHVDAPEAFGAEALSEHLRFMKFIDSVPKASLLDRTRRFRQKYIYVPIVFALLIAIHLAFTAIIMDDGGDGPPPEAVQQQIVPGAAPEGTVSLPPQASGPEAPEAPAPAGKPAEPAAPES